MTVIKNIINKTAVSSFFLALGYGIAFYALQFLFVRLGVFRIAPNNENIIAWDAAWYQDIVRNGTVY